MIVQIFNCNTMKRFLVSLLFLIPVLLSNAQENQGGNPYAQEGEKGIYLFLTDVIPVKGSAYNEIRISRSTGKSDDFLFLGVVRPWDSFLELTENGGSAFLREVMKLKKLPSEEAAWNEIQTHPQLKNFGFLTLDVNFIEKMGAAYLDKPSDQIPQGTLIRYRIEFKSDQAGNNLVKTVQLTKGTHPDIARPKASKVTTGDSLVMISWSAPLTENQEAVFGEVRRITDGNPVPEKVSVCLANVDENAGKVNYFVKDHLANGTFASYFVVPLTLTLLQGPHSDTVSASPLNLSKLPSPRNLTAKDTTSGIWLSWEPPTETRYITGIRLIRATGNDTAYHVIGTFPASSKGFLDADVFPGLLYRYRINGMTMSNRAMPIAAETMAVRLSSNLPAETPVVKTAEAISKGIRITWFRYSWPGVSGYYVYRADNRVQEKVLVSNLIQDTVFTDTSAKDTYRQYRYTVVAAFHSGQQSNPSAPVYCSPSIATNLRAPAGLRGVISGTQVLLTWIDCKTQGLSGYNVYRSDGNGGGGQGTEITLAELMKSGFMKRNSSLVLAPQYVDTYSGKNRLHYAVTVVDETGLESSPAFLDLTTDSALPLPPSIIFLEKLSTGIRISWEKASTTEALGYVIYRRKLGTSIPEKLETVNATKTEFVDTSVTAGVLYFYSIAVTTGDKTGNPCPEKGLRYE
jgi:hypothetical protein